MVSCSRKGQGAVSLLNSFLGWKKRRRITAWPNNPPNRPRYCGAFCLPIGQNFSDCNRNPLLDNLAVRDLKQAVQMVNLCSKAQLSLRSPTIRGPFCFKIPPPLPTSLAAGWPSCVITISRSCPCSMAVTNRDKEDFACSKLTPCITFSENQPLSWRP